MKRVSTVYINGRFCIQPVSGVQRYAVEIVRELDHLAEDSPDGLDFTLLTPRKAPWLGLRRIEQRRVGVLAGHAWDQCTFAAAARDGVALSLANSGPVAHPRHIVTIHDAAVQRHPRHFSPAYRLGHAAIGRLLARRARIATVSEFSRSELADVWGLTPARIIVAPNGWQHLQGEPDPGIVARLGLPRQPYFVVLGNLTRNKNVAVAVRAIRRLPDGAATLVIVGGSDPGVFAATAPSEHEPNVLLPGRLNDAEVAGLMRQARALIFPSIYEGFGIPPLEAFANGCPVLASTAEAVQEVCGDAADYFESHDDVRLAKLMGMVLADDGSWRAARLNRAGERLARYSWRRSARILAAACGDLARGEQR